MRRSCPKCGTTAKRYYHYFQGVIKCSKCGYENRVQDFKETDFVVYSK